MSDPRQPQPLPPNLQQGGTLNRVDMERLRLMFREELERALRNLNLAIVTR